ncbi:MAG: autotransporter subunit beta [Phenylobacterium sp.]|nr:autotransporter subunit beta [Phenylobacterium sp.]
MSAFGGVHAVARDCGGGRGRRLALGLGASIPALAALICAGPAQADTTVSGGSKPVSTSTANAGAPDNVVQTGTLTVPSGPAITIDSNNSVSNSGSIQAQDVNNVTGILALGGHTGAVTNTGTITFNESATTTTTDSAGNIIGPFATGSGRFGVRVQGPGAFTGDLTNSGSINIQGADSAGVSVDSQLLGAIYNAGTITATGTRSFGIRTTAGVSGGVNLTGSVTATGEGAQAVSLGGDVGGGLVISNALSATGYHSIVRGATTALINDQNINDIAQGGPTVSVGGNLGLGLLVAAPPVTISTTVVDANGDGVADATETTGTVASYGSAPAIQVGAVGRDVSLGVVGVGDSAYGVVIEGTVLGSGVRDGVSATGLELGVQGGGAVNLTNGIRVWGSLTANAYSADATALHLNAGASAPVLSNGGQITSVMIGSGAVAARAVVVEAGGSLPVILNSGNIKAVTEGPTGDAVAILDKAGSLTHLENTGTIIAQTFPTTGTTTLPTGSAVAIEDSANTTGFSLLTYQAPGSTVIPTIIGAIHMGSGDDSINVQAGTLTGDLTFGAGANSLTIDGGAAVAGAVTAQGGTLALNVGTGSLQINSTDHLNLTSLNLGAGSTTVFTVDHAAGQATELDVAGAASIATGAKIGVRMTSIQNGSVTYSLIRANQLTAGAVDTSLLATTPYMYGSQFSTDLSAGTLSVTLSRKTAAQLALPSSIAGGYEPVVAAVGKDSALSAALLGQTTRGSFLSAYQQLLPEHSGGIFQMVSAGVEAFGRPLDDRQAGGDGGAWAQEVNFVARAGNTADLSGYNSWGTGLIAGYELPATRAGIFGLSLAGLSGELRPDRSASATDAFANLIEAGGYWRAHLGPLAVNARLAGDYLMASSNRATNFTADGVTPAATGAASAHWNGWGVNSRVRVSYEAHLGDLYLRPQVGMDYLQLNEGGYTETGGGALDLSVQQRKTAELSGFAGVAVGAMFGDQASSWGPEVLLGYRDVVSHSDGSTTATFVSGGDAFTVGPNPIGDSGLVARLGLKSETGPAAFTFDVGGERRSGLNVVDIKLAGHVTF